MQELLAITLNALGGTGFWMPLLVFTFQTFMWNTGSGLIGKSQEMLEEGASGECICPSLLGSDNLVLCHVSQLKST